MRTIAVAHRFARRRRMAVALPLLLSVPPTVAAAAVERPGMAGDADFAADLYRQVATRAGTGNVFLSPFGVRTAVAMTAAGAGGTTARQIAAALRLPPGSPAEVATAFRRVTDDFARTDAGPAAGRSELDVANAVWMQQGVPFRPEFLRRVSTDFAATAERVDFVGQPDASRGQINQWADRQTRGRIRDLLPPGSIKPDTRMVLTDAVYFKGEWARPFEPGRTVDAPFHADPSRDVTCRMMRLTSGTVPVAQTGDVQAAELPYGDGRFALLLVIPRAVDGLATVERTLTGDALRQWTDGLRPTEATVAVPRFTATGSYLLNGPLSALGMADPFDRARADFTGMAAPAADGTGRLYIGDVFHKTFVAVDERGTEAAAATGVRMGATLARRRPPPVELLADRPFLYLIRDRQTGTVLFIGRCADPRP